ncbi:MAG: hypothetical protein A3G87_03850 [Omnitrophica bacterium RIFCSPLOWO2_12_FULL_50_11]|nr:MAG: hypothetical protein A3G87_03850 [Omnitrophica bacterium RIFCSPLOWO2_12_FULL_50_11]
MAQVRKALFLFPAFLLVSTIPVFPQEPLISRVVLSEKEIDLAREEQATIQFELLEVASVGVKVFDESNRLIREIPSDEKLRPGTHSIAWDGRDEKGEQVVSGVYIYVLEARGTTQYVHDLRVATGGEEVFVEKLAWDIPGSKITYLLPKACYVRIRIGLKEGVFLGTLADWTPYEAGEKETAWDGLDPSGHFNLSDQAEAQINISAFALPDNSVIVRSTVEESSLRGQHPKDGPKQSQTVIASSPLRTRRSEGRLQYIHAAHPRPLCHEPRFEVEFPSSKLSPSVGEDKGDGGAGAPVLKGKVPIRITLDPKDKDYLVANRFEVMFFMDSVFLFEQEEATSPLTFYLDTAKLGKGVHRLTINVMDYEDHIGVQTLKVQVEP